jgi:hypothetical protein
VFAFNEFPLLVGSICPLATRDDRRHQNLPKPANFKATRRNCTIRSRTFQLSDRNRQPNLGHSTQPHPPPDQGTKTQPSLRLVSQALTPTYVNHG